MAHTTITVIGGQYDFNTANEGGGIYIDGNDKESINITVTDSNIFKNTTVSKGGGVYLNNSIGS
jgi:hypothetical protein